MIYLIVFIMKINNIKEKTKNLFKFNKMFMIMIYEIVVKMCDTTSST